MRWGGALHWTLLFSEGMVTGGSKRQTGSAGMWWFGVELESWNFSSQEPVGQELSPSCNLRLALSPLWRDNRIQPLETSRF